MKQTQMCLCSGKCDETDSCTEAEAVQLARQKRDARMGGAAVRRFRLLIDASIMALYSSRGSACSIFSLSFSFLENSSAISIPFCAPQNRGALRVYCFRSDFLAKFEKFRKFAICQFKIVENLQEYFFREFLFENAERCRCLRKSAKFCENFKISEILNFRNWVKSFIPSFHHFNPILHTRGHEIRIPAT